MEKRKTGKLLTTICYGNYKKKFEEKKLLEVCGTSPWRQPNSKSDLKVHMLVGGAHGWGKLRIFCHIWWSLSLSTILQRGWISCHTQSQESAEKFVYEKNEKFCVMVMVVGAFTGGVVLPPVRDFANIKVNVSRHVSDVIK